MTVKQVICFVCKEKKIGSLCLEIRGKWLCCSCLFPIGRAVSRIKNGATSEEEFDKIVLHVKLAIDQTLFTFRRNVNELSKERIGCGDETIEVLRLIKARIQTLLEIIEENE